MFTRLFVVTAVFASFASQAATYVIDDAHSTVSFKIRHLVSKVPGSFKDFSGSFDFDPKKPATGNGSFAIKAATITTANDKRDEHLRSPDFFDTAKFPEIKFDNAKISGKKMTGDLTLHGVKKPVTFDIEYTGASKDPYGNDKVGFTATGKINRKDFGITWNKALDAGGMVLGEDVDVVVDVEANLKK